MRKTALLLFGLIAISVQAQQKLCLGDTSPKTYKVSPTIGSTYAWSINSGVGMIIKGQGSNEVKIKWDQTVTAAEVQVTETNGGGCIGAPIVLAVSFSGPTANFQGVDQRLCTPPNSTGFSVQLIGEAPWSIEYTVNGTSITANNISESPYALEIPNMKNGNNYEVKLTFVSDKNCPGAVSGSSAIIEIPDKINTSTIRFSY